MYYSFHDNKYISSFPKKKLREILYDNDNNKKIDIKKSSDLKIIKDINFNSLDNILNQFQTKTKNIGIDCKISDDNLFEKAKERKRNITFNPNIIKKRNNKNNQNDRNNNIQKLTQTFSLREFDGRMIHELNKVEDNAKNSKNNGSKKYLLNKIKPDFKMPKIIFYSRNNNLSKENAHQLMTMKENAILFLKDKTENHFSTKDSNNMKNKNINLNNNIIKLKKEIKKNGYKGNTYNLKYSKDNSLVVITMDNISYLTSDENTINQISDLTINNNSIENKNDLDDNNCLKDSLDDITVETKKIKYYTNNFFEKSELIDSLEISNDNEKYQRYINSKEKTPNEFENKYSNKFYSNTLKNKDYSKKLDDVFSSIKIDNNSNSQKKYSYFKLIKNGLSMNNDKLLNTTKTNKNTYYSSIKANKNICYSQQNENTDNSTYKIVNNNNSIENINFYDKSNKKYSSISKYGKTDFSNTNRTYRNSFNSIVSTISQTNKKKRNYKKAQSFSKENEKNNLARINKNCSFLLNWLINIQLSSYYKNFIDNEIYDINRLIEQMKSPINKFEYEDIENILSIHKPGHIFRILTQLEIDGDIIDKNISNFMIDNSTKDIFESSNISKKLIFSNYEKYNCDYYCCNMGLDICGEKNGKKNDLKSFLIRYNLLNLYQNFIHNGFDLINYVILQMYGSYPINEDILENYFHIYDEKQRNLLLKAIEKEINKINSFLNSEKYYENENNSMIKYDKVIFDKDSNLGNISEIKIDDKKNECLIY